MNFIIFCGQIDSIFFVKCDLVSGPFFKVLIFLSQLKKIITTEPLLTLAGGIA